MKAIVKYAQMYVQAKAYARICDDLKDAVLQELKLEPDGKALANGVEFHRTTRIKKIYAPDIELILVQLQSQIDDQKERAETAGRLKLKKTQSFDAAIPKSAQEDVLGAVKEYAKHFGA